MRYMIGMHSAAITLTFRVVQLTLQLSLERHSRPASERQGVITREPRPLANTRQISKLERLADTYVEAGVLAVYAKAVGQ
jgi:hypothetical protein